MRGSGFVTAAVLSIPLWTTASADPENHYDSQLAYISCDQSTWRAAWSGDDFMHWPDGPNPRGKTHPDKVIRYLTWDHTCWEAHWDPKTRDFDHVPLPAPDPANGRTDHHDIILNYISWDGSKWSTVRDHDGFYHIFVAPPPAKGSGLLGSVVHFFDQTGKAVQVAIPIVQILAGS